MSRRALREREPAPRAAARPGPGLRAVAFVVATALLSGAAGCRRSDEGKSAASPPTGPHPLAAPYLQAAFGNRWGGEAAVLRKWTHPVTIRVGGTPRYEDRLQLRRAVQQLAELPHLVDVELAEWEDGPADLEIVYLPIERYPPAANDAERSYLARYTCEADAEGALQHGRILLPSDQTVPQYMRDNLLLEGIAACFGLAGGLAGPDDSALFSEPNWNVGSWAELDLRLLDLHYRPELPAGLDRAAAAARLGLVPSPGPKP